MTTAREELLASNLRQQIAYLEELLADLESHAAPHKDFVSEMQHVEAKLRDLRNHLLSRSV